MKAKKLEGGNGRKASFTSSMADSEPNMEVAVAVNVRKSLGGDKPCRGGPSSIASGRPLRFIDGVR